MIIKTSFIKGDPAIAQAPLVAHLEYVEHWWTENESRDDRHLFTKDEDQVQRSAAVQDVMKHAHSQVAYHTILLSPGEDEPITDWCKWTRGVMDDLEKKQGRKLHWYAVKCDNTDNPPVHVVLAGTGDNLLSGKREVVRMYRSDYELLRQSGIDRSDHDWSRQKASHEEEDHPSS